MRVTLLALSLLVAGCDSIFGCDTETQVIELEHDWQGTGGPNPFDELSLKWARDDGFDCRDDGAIRNAFGVEIGRRYVCTKCD